MNYEEILEFTLSTEKKRTHVPHGKVTMRSEEALERFKDEPSRVETLFVGEPAVLIDREAGTSRYIVFPNAGFIAVFGEFPIITEFNAEDAERKAREAFVAMISAHVR